MDVACLQTKPELNEYEQAYLEAFMALSGTRDVSIFGIQRIKFQEIKAWLDINGIEGIERRQEMTHFIRFLDQQYIEGLRECPHSA